jgi:glycosyltransferase involved in cell wall biosynthesis
MEGSTSHDPREYAMPSDPVTSPKTKPARSETTVEPLVSLGLPVYNGADFLRQALDSILAQTYRKWELILSDNASTDATESICREYAARDPRIRYYREPVNHGAIWNFNRVFDLAEGPLFRWTAHDDVAAPELLERSVAVMLSHPEVVLCHPRTRIINEKGQVVGDYQTRLRTDSDSIRNRFHDLICVDHACYPIFGMVRTRLLRRVPPMGDYIGSDRCMLAELSMYGPFHELPEFLFLRRDHPGTSTRKFPSLRERMLVFHANSSGGTSHPTLKRALEYWSSIVRVPLRPSDRMACIGVLGKWISMRVRSVLNRNLPGLAKPDIPAAARPAPARGAASLGSAALGASVYSALKRALNFTPPHG